MARFSVGSGGGEGTVGPTGPQGPQGPAGADADLLNVDSNIVPDTDNAYTLGTAEKRWAGIHVGPGTIYITDTVTNEDTELTVTDGVLQIDGANQLQVGQLKFVDNTIESTSGDIEIQIGLTESTADLKINRNTVFAEGKSLTFPDDSVQTTAAVNADWDATAGLAEILNKPDIAAEAAPVETSFTVNGGTLGTQPTFTGSPLFSGSYVKTGPMVHFQIQVDMDNITNFGTGQYYVDLPFPAKYGYKFREGCLHDVSANKDYAIGGHVYAGESRLTLGSTDTQSGTVFDIEFDYNSPVTLSTADNFHISGTYISE
jgi:hypothetical protein